MSERRRVSDDAERRHAPVEDTADQTARLSDGGMEEVDERPTLGRTITKPPTSSLLDIDFLARTLGRHNLVGTVSAASSSDIHTLIERLWTVCWNSRLGRT